MKINKKEVEVLKSVITGFKASYEPEIKRRIKKTYGKEFLDTLNELEKKVFNDGLVYGGLNG